MHPSHYMTANDKTPYPIKRRVKGRRNDEGNEPAITLLPPDPYIVIDDPDLPWFASPRVYRTIAPKSAKNREASSFVILGDTITSPVQSRPGSPSGRVSPFRGRGFKSPASTRPSSRAASPGPSPIKGILKKRRTDEPERSALENRRDFNRYIGLPPKTPIGGRKTCAISGSGKITAEESESLPANFADRPFDFLKPECEESAILSGEHSPNRGILRVERVLDNSQLDGLDLAEKLDAIAKNREMEATPDEMFEPIDKPMPVEFYKNEFSRRSSPVLPTAHRNKLSSRKNECDFQQRNKTMRFISKPPVPPKKIGLKTSLKANDGDGEPRIKCDRGFQRGGKSGARDKEKLTLHNENKTDGQETRGTQRKQQKDNSKGADKRESVVLVGPGIDLAGATRSEDKALNGVKKSVNEIQDDGTADAGKIDVREDVGEGIKFGGSYKLVPCQQSDKCHIAPPTMASPSSIITPSMSTPPTSSDLASGSAKNSQSISAAPTTVTSSNLSSVSSTVVLAGNLARKENASSKASISHETAEGEQGKKGELHTSSNVETNRGVFGSESALSTDMVRAGNKDLKKPKATEEIASATSLIKAKPDMEVLSPNNLRNPPARMPPPNMAWDERVPNGDVSSRAPTVGKFRRFLSAICKLLSCLFCCRCSMSPCCKNTANAASSQSSCCGCCGPLLGCLPCNRSKGKCCGGKSKDKIKARPKGKSGGKCCAKPICSCCSNCCDRVAARCLVFRQKINSFCRCLFCLNLTCCQNLLKKCKCCHRMRCCQSNGCCSCCNPFAKSDPKALVKKGSRASNNSRGNNQLDPVLVEHTSRMKAAIPVLPSCLAIFCLICNTFVPGLGTIVSGLLCLCFGKPRFSIKDNPINRFKSFIINIIIGVAQAFTVVFCLVGWGWSIWWGVIMYKLSTLANQLLVIVVINSLILSLSLLFTAGRQKRLKLAEDAQKEAGSSSVNQNHVDVEQG